MILLSILGDAWVYGCLVLLTLPLSGKPSFLNESRGLMAACPLEGLVRRCLTAENVSIGYDSYHLNVG